MTVIVAFVPPGKPVTLNTYKGPRAHFRDKREWRNTAHVMACTLGPPSKRRVVGRAEVRVSFPVLPRHMNTHRDPSNWTITTKWIIDGLTEAGVFVDDDSTHVLELAPAFHSSAVEPRVVVYINAEG